MNKVLIVASVDSMVLARAITKILELMGFGSEICLHKEALATMLSEDFSRIIVLDYSEGETKDAGGFASYRDLVASATGQIIIRLGFENHSHADYVKMPFELDELYRLLKTA